MRATKLTEKDLSVLDDTLSARTQHRTPSASLKDYSLTHKVKMEWDLNEEAKRDMIFKLTVGNNTVLLDWEEVLKAGRFI